MEENEALVIKISAVSNWGLYTAGLIVIGLVFIGGSWILLSALFRVRTWTEALAFLPVVAFLFLWYGIGARLLLASLSTVELSVRRGTFWFLYSILCWSKAIQAGRQDVTAVTARSKWYWNRLKITVGGKSYSLAGLMDEDLAVVSQELKRALPGEFLTDVN